jgi:hypothetical protein
MKVISKYLVGSLVLVLLLGATGMAPFSMYCPMPWGPWCTNY